MCLLTTFEAFAARERLDLVGWEARVGGMVDRTDTGLRFTKFNVEVDMEVSDVELARKVLEDTKTCCLVSNGLTAPVEIEAKIHQRIRKAG